MSHFPSDIMERLNNPLSGPFEVAALWAGPQTVDAADPAGRTETVSPGDHITIYGLDAVGSDADFIIRTRTGNVMCCGHYDVSPVP